MDIFTLIILAFALAMDAFAMAITNGMVYQKYTFKNMLEAAFFFGLFQGMMPLIGYFAARNFSQFVQDIDHWIALILLGYIGGKMIFDSFSKDDDTKAKEFSFKQLIIQAIATSIDALAVGISFAFLNINIFEATLIIGLITFIVCIFGAIIGKKIGLLLKNKSLFIGGIILISIGIKIFVEHVF